MTRISPTRRSEPNPEPKRGAKAERKPRKRLKYMSDDRKQTKAETDEPRREFVKAAGACMVEGCPNVPMPTTHEITCGNGRNAALKQPRMQMAVCPEHHYAFHNDVAWTKKRQLAARVRWELALFASEFSVGLGAAPSYFTVDDLIDYLMFQKSIKPKRKRKVKA